MGADVLGVVVVDLIVKEYVDAVLLTAAAAVVVVVVVLVLVDLVAEVLVVELGGRWAALVGVAREVIAETASINNNELTIWNMQDRQI